MDELAIRYPGRLLSLDDALEREFESLLPGASRLAFRVAYAVLRHREDAEDVAQEALARAHAGFGRLRERDRFHPWLVRIAWRMALDHRRSSERRGRREQLAGAVPAPTVEELAATREVQERVREAIDGLPEKLRIAVVLSALEGRDVREVARLLELPEGTVKSRLHLGRRALAERLRWIVSGTARR